MFRRVASLVVGFCCEAFIAPAGFARADELPFTIDVRAVPWAGAPTLQSFAIARDGQGRWLCLGGRTAGLHGLASSGVLIQSNFQGFNDRVWAVDVGGPRVCSRALANLVAKDVADSLTVTGCQSAQVGDKLYLVGGYGYSPDHRFMQTYRVLTVVDVTATVQAVLTGGPIGNHIRQSAADDLLAVTGGELESIDGTFYLVFGQNYFGFYTQRNGDYTYQVRPFQVTDDGTTVSIVKKQPVGCKGADPQFRRRDLNLVQAIRPDGRRRLTVYGGVFDPSDIDAKFGGPFRRPIDIDPGGDPPAVSVDASGFQQQLSQYNCAVLPIHRTSDRSMAVVFFGGISEAYYTGLEFRWDNNLPFVDHVGCITRSAGGDSREWLVCRRSSGQPCVNLRLPGLLGTAAKFIPAQGAPFDGGVLDLDAIRADTLVGYVYGGVAATRGSGGASQAGGQILAVWIGPGPAPAIAVPPRPAHRVLPSRQSQVQ